MNRLLEFAMVGAFLLTVAGADAASGPGQCFNGGTPNACSPSNCPGDPNNLDCSADDTGCVSNTKSHRICSDAIGKAFCQLVSCVIGCHKKQADARFKAVDQDTADTAEDACEGSSTSPDTEKSCGGKLNRTLNKLFAKGVCEPAQIANAGSERAVLIGEPAPIPSLSLDGQNGGVYCDSTGGADFIEDLDCAGGSNNGNDCTTDADCPGGKCLREDTGWVPKTKNNLACEDTLGREIGKLVCCTIKCHAAMNAKFFAGKPYDEEACEESSTPAGKGCVDKFNKVRDKTIAKGLCPPCNDQNGWDGQNANAVGTVDGANVIAYPCGLGP
jgi:hypothetical protein